MNNKFVPLVAIILSVAAFGTLLTIAMGPGKTTQKSANTNTVVQTNENLNVNTNEPTNTNTNVPVTYASPTGPFTVTDSSLAMIAYRKSTDRLITRLAKINAKNGEIEATKEMRTTDIQASLGFTTLPSAPSTFRFGRDGDSIIFSLSGQDQNSPYTGLYRTSFSTPDKIETLVQYDRDHLYKNDIPTIGNFIYHAETNQLAFVIQGENGVANNDVKIMRLADKEVRDLKSYKTTPQLVGFPANGAMLEVLWTDRVKYSEPAKDKWFYDQITLSDESVKTTLIVDEGTIEPRRNVYLTPDNIAPNNKQVAWVAETKDGTNVLRIHTIAGQKNNDKKLENLNSSSFQWSTDSSKLTIYQNYKNSILDLDDGSLEIMKDVSQPILWSPGNYLFFTNSQNELYAYNPSTKKSVGFEDLGALGSYGYGEYGGYYGGPGGSLGLNWINR